MYNLCTVFRLRTLKHWWFTGQSVMYIKYTVPKNLNHSIKTEPVSAGADAIVRVLYICLFNLDRYRRKWKPDIYSYVLWPPLHPWHTRFLRGDSEYFLDSELTLQDNWAVPGLSTTFPHGDSLSHSLLNVPHSYIIWVCSAQYHTARSQVLRSIILRRVNWLFCILFKGTVKQDFLPVCFIIRVCPSHKVMG